MPAPVEEAPASLEEKEQPEQQGAQNSQEE